MSSSARTKILVDTTYLLPRLDVRVREVEEALGILNSLHESGLAELYLSPFSLLEAVGKIARLAYDPRTVGKGLLALLASGVYSVALPDADGYLEAVELRAAGFGDIVDLLLYETAKAGGLRFLTRDRELAAFVRERGGDVGVFLSEEELEAMARRS